MIEKFQTLIKKGTANPLLFGSFLILLGTTIGNFFHFLFNLFMTRNLSVSDYGILASLLSLIVLPTVFSSAVFPTVVSFAATYFARNEIALVKRLFITIGKFSFFLGLAVLLFFVVFSGQIGAFFQVDDTGLIMLAGVNVFLGFIMIVNSALLQSKLAFTFVSFSNFLSSLLKFIFGVGLVLIGYNVFGAMVGMVLAAVVSYAVSFIPLRKIFTHPVSKDNISIVSILRFGGPAALIFFSLTSLITIDIVLVKHFFEPRVAGLYAGLSLIGRVIFLLSAPVNTVVFPLLTQKHTKKEDLQGNVMLSLGLILIPSLILTVIYALVPSFIITFFLKNDEYLQIKEYLTLFAIFVTCYSLMYVLSNIFLSMKRTEISYPLSIGAIMQIVLIWFFHDSFSQIISISLSIVSILLCLLLVYYWHIVRKPIRQ